jgi:hypothetical protein
MGKKEARRQNKKSVAEVTHYALITTIRSSSGKKIPYFLSEPLSKYRNFQSFELFLMFAKSTFESSNQRNRDGH